MTNILECFFCCRALACHRFQMHTQRRPIQQIKRSVPAAIHRRPCRLALATRHRRLALAIRHRRPHHSVLAIHRRRQCRTVAGSRRRRQRRLALDLGRRRALQLAIPRANNIPHCQIRTRQTFQVRMQTPPIQGNTNPTRHTFRNRIQMLKVIRVIVINKLPHRLQCIRALAMRPHRLPKCRATYETCADRRCVCVCVCPTVKSTFRTHVYACECVKKSVRSVCRVQYASILSASISIIAFVRLNPFV